MPLVMSSVISWRDTVRVKICGITHKEDALRSLELGADMLGIVFAPRSPRYLSPEEARILVAEVPSSATSSATSSGTSSATFSATFVGVFVDEEPQTILDIAKTVGLNKIQLQGSETPETCRELNSIIPTIKAFRVDKNFLHDPQQPERYMETEAHLFDSKVEGKEGSKADSLKGYSLEGGSGQTFDWHVLASIPRCRPRILAGGLGEHNIVEAVRVVRPDVVDLSTSLAEEENPRRKDFDKMKRFFRKLESL